MKKDAYFRNRGGVAYLCRILCLCGEVLFTYQKDGRGSLKRCYLNRIMDSDLATLEKKVKGVSDMPNLACPRCGEIVGTPMLHWEGRLAFKLRIGRWRKERM